MSAVAAQPRPLVVVLYRVPLFVEAVQEELREIAEVHAFRADDSNVDGLVEALRPDAIVVEAPQPPDVGDRIPVLHVALEHASLSRRAPGGSWEPLAADLSPAGIRNALVPALLGRNT